MKLGGYLRAYEGNSVKSAGMAMASDANEKIFINCYWY